MSWKPGWTIRREGNNRKVMPIDTPIPASRSTDPPTSKRAEQQMHYDGRLPLRRLQTLRVLSASGGDMTAAELGMVFQRRHPDVPTARETPRKRLSELFKLSLAERGPVKKCKVSGVVAVTWHITKEGQDALLDHD